MIANAAWIPGAFVTGLAIGTPWSAAVLLMAWRQNTRIVGFMAALVSAAASALLLLAAPAGESLYEALMLLFSCLSAGAALMIPKRDCDSRTIGGILFLLGATLLVYSSSYRVKELGALWGLSANTIIRMFATEDGVLKLDNVGNGKQRAILSIPESVALRVHGQYRTAQVKLRRRLI